jgi:CRISPR-associated protein Cas1
MHSGSENKVPLVYDLMEPLRPLVDRKILGFALGHIFTSGDFTINSAGGCRLNPQMAKVVAGQLMTMSANRVVKEFIGLLR